jgi:hypothetical protein
MRLDNLFVLILSTLIIEGCGGGSSEGKNNSENNTGSNGSNLPSSDNVTGSPSNGDAENPSPSSLSGNIIFAIEGLMEKSTEISQYTSITVNSKLPAFHGRDTKTTNITIPSPTIILHNNSRYLKDWHCYQTDGLTVQRENKRLILEGVFSEYRYDNKINACSNERLEAYSFHNAVFNNSLIFNTAASIKVKDKSGIEKQLPTYQFIATAYAEQSKFYFGNAWERMQRSKIGTAAVEAGASIFVLDHSSGDINLDVSKLSNPTITDFTSLDKKQILSGSIWGMPGQGKADERWCGIINIPHDTSSDSIKYQSVIATNCARSSQRYCDAHGSLFLGGNYPPVAPVAWDENTASNAQLNSNEQYHLDKQGHFITNSSAQNVFVIPSNTAIIPIFGYSEPRNDGKINNAGQKSWVGHEGHCQNVMNQRYTRLGVSHRTSKEAPSKGSYWTQDFN